MGKEASTACNYKPDSAFPNSTSLAAGNLDLVRLSSEVVRCFSPQVYNLFSPAVTDAG
jgi:hypothetical protein